VREHTAEYTPGASTPVLNAAQAVLWYSTFMLQTGEQLARKASQYPGVALAAAEMWRKRNRYAGLDREAELWFGGRKWYKQRGPEWVALPWNTLLLPETARPGPTITAEKGPGLLSVRLRVVPAEEAGVWGELALDPAAWLEEKLVPGARMLAEGSGRSSYNVGKQLPVVGRYASLREEIPGSPGDWGSPVAKLGRGEDVTNEELAPYIMPQATRAAALRLSNFDPATGQKLAKDDPRRIPTGQMARAWTQYQKTRACPLECQAGKVMWREDPQKAAQYELEMMRLMYDLRLAGRRTGLSFDVEFGSDLLKNMNLGQLVEAQAEALWKQSQGIKPLASPKLYQEQIDDRTSYNPETGQYMGKGPRTHFEQLDSIWEAMGRGTTRPTGTAQPQAEGAAR
jgi:glycerophosphoryl diester phosphodiesterase